MQKLDKGFTLVEVMAALSIIMVIILFLVSFEMKYFKQVYVTGKTKEYTIFIDALEKEIRSNLPKELRIGVKYISAENSNINWVKNSSMLFLNDGALIGDRYCQINFLNGREGVITVYDKELRGGSIFKKIYYY